MGTGAALGFEGWNLGSGSGIGIWSWNLGLGLESVVEGWIWGLDLCLGSGVGIWDRRLKLESGSGSGVGIWVWDLGSIHGVGIGGLGSESKMWICGLVLGLDLGSGSSIWDPDLGSRYGIWALCLCRRVLTPCPVPRREDGGWWRSWLQQSYQAVKEKVGTGGTGWEPPAPGGNPRHRAGPAGAAPGLKHSPGGSPQRGIGMDFLGISWLWVMLGSVM